MSTVDVIVAPGHAVTVAGTCYRQGERLPCPVADATRWLAEGLVQRPQPVAAAIGQAHDLAEQVRTGLDIALASLPAEPAAEALPDTPAATSADTAAEPTVAAQPAPEPTPVHPPAPPAKSGRAAKK